MQSRFTEAPGALPPLLAGASGFALGSTVLASLLVPGAVGLPVGRAGSLVLVLFLLVAARIGRLVASSHGAAPDRVDDLGRAVPTLVLVPVAGTLAALLASTIAGSTRLDQLAISAAGAGGAPRALLAASLGLLAIVDRDTGADAAVTGRGWPQAALEAERVFRFVIFLTLLALVLPPSAAADATAGPLLTLASIPLYLGKVAILAFLAGLSGPLRTGLRAAALLGAAAFLGMLGAVLVAVGQTLE